MERPAGRATKKRAETAPLLESETMVHRLSRLHKECLTTPQLP